MLVVSHVLKTAVRAFFRIAFTFVLVGAIGGGLSLLVAYQTTQEWPPTVLTDMIGGTIGVLLGYAAGLRVLVREAIPGVRTAEHDIAGSSERVVEAPARHP
jgi:hypothetical protein